MVDSSVCLPLKLTGKNQPLLLNVKNQPILVNGKNQPILVNGKKQPILVNGKKQPLFTQREEATAVYSTGKTKRFYSPGKTSLPLPSAVVSVKNDGVCDHRARCHESRKTGGSVTRRNVLGRRSHVDGLSTSNKFLLVALENSKNDNYNQH